jgi:hypothetical protein
MNNMSDERQAFDLSIPLRVKINGEEVAACSGRGPTGFARKAASTTGPS